MLKCYMDVRIIHIHSLSITDTEFLSLQLKFIKLFLFFMHTVAVSVNYILSPNILVLNNSKI